MIDGWRRGGYQVANHLLADDALIIGGWLVATVALLVFVLWVARK